MSDSITLTIDGREYTDFTQIKVVDSFLMLCKHFSADVTLADNTRATPLKINAPCYLSVSGLKVMTGYIEKIQIVESSRKIKMRISGRDKLCDLVDSTVDASIVQPFTGNIFFDDLCREVLGKLKLPASVISSVFPRPFFGQGDYVTPETGTGFYEYLEKYANKLQLFLNSDANGNLLIRTAKDAETIPNLLLMENGGANNNIISSMTTYDAPKLFNQYRCHTQQQKIPLFIDELLNVVDFQNQVTDVLGTASNSAVRTSRIYNFIASTAMDTKTATARAVWESNYANSEYFSYQCVVAGYTYDGINVWRPNLKVHVIDYHAGVDAVLLISQVTYKMSIEGLYCQMTLVLPDSFTLKAERDAQSKISQSVGKIFDNTQ